MTGSGTQAPALITKSEAARLLGISRNSIYKLIASGQLRAVSLGDGMHQRLRLADVLALARSEP